MRIKKVINKNLKGVSHEREEKWTDFCGCPADW